MNSNGPLKLWYQGTINPSQIPLTIIDSIAQTIGVELAFVGFGRDEYVKEILERSKSLGISDRVLFLGTPATRAELYDLSRNRHVGLVLFEIPFRDSMAGASQKPFEYMAAGMALLVPDVAEWNSFAIQRGYGLGCLPNNVSNLAQTLRTLHDNRQMVLEMGRRARGRILQEWNYECLFSPVVDLMEQDT